MIVIDVSKSALRTRLEFRLSSDDVIECEQCTQHRVQHLTREQCNQLSHAVTLHHALQHTRL